jgi:hypothetical protein
MSAIVIGLISWSLTLTVGKFILGMTAVSLLWIFFCSVLGGFLGLLVTMKAAARKLIRGVPAHWATISSVYFIVLLTLAPEMRHWVRILWLFIPLQLGHALVGLLWGPLQDRWVRKSQRANPSGS